MSIKVSIEIESVNASNKKITDKVSYVNPEATDKQLTDFAKMLESLTTNTYQGTTKITEETIG